MKASDILHIREQREMTAMQERMLAESWKAFAGSSAGADFLNNLSELESQALRAIQDCADYRESTELLMRYQQRRHVCSQLRKYMAAQIESLGGDQNEHDPDTGTDDSTDSITAYS